MKRTRLLSKPLRRRYSVYQMLLLTSASIFLNRCGTITWASFDIADQVFDLDMVDDNGKRKDGFRDDKAETQISVSLVDDDKPHKPASTDGDAQDYEVPFDEAFDEAFDEDKTPYGSRILPLEPLPTEPPSSGLASDVPEVKPLPVQTSPELEQDPVGPPLGISAARFECKVTTQKVLREGTSQSAFLNWPWLFGVAVPISFFGSIALILGSVWAMNDVIDGKTPTYLLAALSLAWITYFVGDIVGLAMVVNRGSHSERDQVSTTSDWAREPLGCQGGFLVGGGYRIPLRPNGSLDRWDEAYVVRAWANGKGPSQLWLRDKKLPLQIPKAKRCQWAEERGYDFEYCRD
ncbi:MAG: hypothetical protein GY822_14235 [Deltaproteobacteria bacterium]|nr:hypothetical protein [Deltaproteobacteria bacterium]